MSVTRLCFRLQAGKNIIDIARALSLHNRTHKIHQKQVFTVLGGMVTDNTDNKVELATAPNTWYMKAAVNMCFDDWKTYRHNLLKDSNLQGSKYSDFRLKLNNLSGALIRKPIGYNREEIAEEEWEYSALTNEAGLTKTIQIVGDHGTTRYSATKGWLQRTGIPYPASEPPMVDFDGVNGPDYKDDFMITLNGTTDNVSDRVEDVVEENDERPYPLLDIYTDVNDQFNLQSQCLVYTSQFNPTQMIPGFKALCGLIELDVLSGTAENGPLLYIDVLNNAEGF